MVDLHVGDGLPLVHGDEPPVLAAVAPAAEVDDQLARVAVEGGEDGVEAGLGEGAVGEEEGGDDDLVGAGVYPLSGVGVVDAAADLQPPGPRPQRLPRGLPVTGAEHDDVGAGEGIVAVQRGEVGGRVRRDKVGLEGAGLAVESPADNLLDLARVQVDAGPEARHFGRVWSR